VRRLPALKPGEVIHILERAGYYIDHVHGSHYQMYDPLSQRRVTVPYHGNRDIPRRVLQFIIKQSILSREEFLSLRQ
jgi:predicted RNA binding protein YcfA (HicA-like mRNA interferase family)